MLIFSKTFKSGQASRQRKSIKIFVNPSYNCILTGDRRKDLERELIFINEMDKSSQQHSESSVRNKSFRILFHVYAYRALHVKHIF